MTLRVKQRADHADWLPILADAYTHPDHARADRLIDTAVARIHAFQRTTRAGKIGYGWSGGKDSQALRIVCEEAYVAECYLAISNLEWPAFLAWATDHMPDRLTVILRDRVNLDWLRANPAMLFPDAYGASRWFQMIQGTGRRTYARQHRMDAVLLGRRTADGNQVVPRRGARGTGPWWYTDHGFLVASPLHDWTHEDVLCVLGSRDAPLPPNYTWPRGFRVGTGSWPARQWCTPRQGWAECITIDRTVVEAAARARIPGAEAALCAD
jgi:3'-phosphoadenosine 5'-phosphosulfate sulfotransferase (PAPS reductase)/FAD synthetase